LQTNKHANKNLKTVKELEAWKSPTFVETKTNSNQKSSELCSFFFVGKVSFWSGLQGFCCAQIREEVDEDGVLPTTIA
jgi:hypothetical protein